MSTTSLKTPGGGRKELGARILACGAGAVPGRRRDARGGR